MTRKEVIYISGFGGTGKSTLADKYKKQGYNVLHLDDLVRNVVFPKFRKEKDTINEFFNLYSMNPKISLEKPKKYFIKKVREEIESNKKLVIEGLIKNHRMFQKIFKDVEFKFYFVKPKSIKDFGERIINRVVENPANYGRLFYLEKEDKLTEREGLNDFIKNRRNGKLFIKLVEETAKKNYKKIDELLDYFNSICSGIEVISV